jgi:hypothetical protein
MGFWQKLSGVFSSVVFWTTLAQIGAAVFIALGWLATRRTWRTTKETQSYQIMLELMRDYGTPEVGNAVKVLHEFFNESDKNIKKLIAVYKAIISVPGERNPALNTARRTASTFLQRLGVMHHNKVLSADLVSGFWHKDDLETIVEIVVALDTRDLKPGDPLPAAFQNLRDLIDELRGIQHPAPAVGL